MTRTHNKHLRVYANGLDLSGFSRQVGELAWFFDAQPEAALTDEVKNILIGKGNISAGPINAFMDNTPTTGPHANFATGLGTVNLAVAIGANAAPAQGDHCFAWVFEESAYKLEQGSGFVGVNLTVGDPSYSGNLTYRRPWGRILHAKGDEIDVNAATGIDDNAASSALGGIFVYHLFSSDGTVTLKVQDASTNSDGSFSDLSGATSGSIDASVTPKYGMVSLGVGATVRRYLRWQLELGTATTANFFAAFIRNGLLSS